MALPDNVSDYLSKDAIANITAWLEEPKYAEYKDELEELIRNEEWKTLEDSFFKVVEFGTGGRRGTTGIGPNRINRITIGESAQALCEYARAADSAAPTKGVVIAYDTRLTSPELSRFTAQVCAANGFKAYLFDSFRATPELSFAVRYLEAAVGIVISASHNPPLDNGFKAYWNDGAQLVAPHDKGVLDAAAALQEINSMPFEQAVEEGLIVLIGDEIDEVYVKTAANQAEGVQRDLKIVYSPLHGAGQTNVLPVLQQAGFKDISVVEDQMVPDGNFPTIENGKPNPEEKAANDRAVAQLLSEEADIAITNDPDADRIGVVVRTGNELRYLSGNQSAVLATDYTLQKMRASANLTAKHYIAKTIVTTDMLNALAEKYGVTSYGNMLVGFKYIGELIRNKEATDEVFVIGGEESYGLLKGSYARDKDGATGALPMAEYAAELKQDGKTLYDRLLELYGEYGLYVERLDNMVCPGADGFEKMQGIMHRLRTTPPAKVGNHDVTAIIDYSTLLRRDLATSEETAVNCIKGNVLVLEFGDERRRITVRPSGTEPKIKFYVQWYVDTASQDPSEIEKQYDEVTAELEGLSRQLEGLLLD